MSFEARMTAKGAEQAIGQQAVAQYALSDIHKPMGIASYQLTHTLPDTLLASLPSIEAIEREFGESDMDGRAGV